MASGKKTHGGVQFEILKNPGVDFYSGFRKTSQWGGGGGCNPQKVGPRSLKTWIRHWIVGIYFLKYSGDGNIQFNCVYKLGNLVAPGGYDNGQGILFSISAIWLINSTPRAIDYFNSWWCVIEQLHATRHPLDYILVMRACPHLCQRSTLHKLPNSSYRDQIFMHRRSIDLSAHMFARIARGVTGNHQHSQIKSNQIKCFYWHTWFTSLYIIYIYYNNNIRIQYCIHLITRGAGKLG